MGASSPASGASVAMGGSDEVDIGTNAGDGVGVAV